VLSFVKGQLSAGPVWVMTYSCYSEQYVMPFVPLRNLYMRCSLRLPARVVYTAVFGRRINGPGCLSWRSHFRLSSS